MKAVFRKLEKKFKLAMTFLLMIDLPPRYLTCVNTTLKYFEELSLKSNKVPACTLTKHSGRKPCKFCCQQ